MGNNVEHVTDFGAKSYFEIEKSLSNRAFLIPINDPMRTTKLLVRLSKSEEMLIPTWFFFFK